MTMTGLTQETIEEINDELGVDVHPLIKCGLLDSRSATKWLVRRLYYRMAKEDRTYADIKYELSIRYDISVSSIEKMVYRKN
jgi:hypothetical protein